jgi:ribosome-associated toxin RatA of RatAB toxin-antitoxin module
VPTKPALQQSLLLPFSALQLFNLVNDVASYPSFLPWCSGATVTPLGDNELEARLDIAFMGISSFFATRNRNSPPHRIDMSYSGGPFANMVGNWQFVALGEQACKVVFELDYRFESRALEMVIGPVFSHITGRFIDAFGREAEKRYGSKS